MFQKKEQDKISEQQLSEADIGNTQERVQRNYHKDYLRIQGGGNGCTEREVTRNF